MGTDTEVILNALQKERDELHDKIMQVDRIIKRVKSLEYNPDQQQPVKELSNDTAKPEQPLVLFPKHADIKVQVLRVFDIIGKASKLGEIQKQFTQLTGNKYPIREAMRNLHKAGLLRNIREQRITRGYLWVKTAWLENEVLEDKYKPEGFDVLYKAENIIYE